MRFRTAIAISAATIVVGGCGDETIHQLPPAAEPPHSPATTTSPAGKLIRVGKRPEGVVVDPATGRVAVAERNPPALEIVGHKKVKLAGAPRHLALAGTTVLVPEETANSFTTVGLDGRPGRGGGGG
ncbi:MAG: hypothetical protein J2O48_07665, partial [Solirubrobacterales bacterium]|nr:hypothetical protein [Solirubrobacterales bacterium]